MRVDRVAGASVAAAGFVLLTAALASAHDFWLIPNAFRLEVGDQQTVLGRTSSSFPSSVSADWDVHWATLVFSVAER